ncbi:hypothetical protein [Chitinophaga sp. CF418]|uniref:hypothetical protein n=1 Tax=Chitinophaga sp. CF418 TaxID=1855287 RepID=UPI00122D07C4|nr:hypothetical protein [Chitinophaga sp. CF418]
MIRRPYKKVIGRAKVAPGFRWEWRAFGSPVTRQMLLNVYSKSYSLDKAQSPSREAPTGIPY